MALGKELVEDHARLPSIFFSFIRDTAGKVTPPDQKKEA